ncbi:MFS transporter [Ramlibacter algicola]|uniref:MFS transporter n=1 Tax=Ramlibacter algicola TaxID=2795217 RepID=A0A934UTF7_9BURK|nr:MFS transporter [Ramlibacter algicola]MBK0394901.1 MFS transporter [Ramlibacter algicola]
MTSPTTCLGAAGGTPARTPPGLPLLVMLSGTFLVVLDFFIVNVALPSIQQELQATNSELQWVVAGYGLATATGLVAGGRLGDMFGRRRMFMVGLFLFTLASLGCGLAPTATVLVAARVAQGLAAAVLQPQVLAMLSTTYTGAARARSFAAYGIVLGVAATLGQLAGGALIAADWGGLGWRSCFLVNVPVGLAALAAAPRTLARMAGHPGARSLDIAGMLLIAASAVGLVYPLVEGHAGGWPAWTFIVLGLSFALLVLFSAQQKWREARGRDPLVPGVLLANGRFLAGLATALAFYAGNASLYFVVALHLQQERGLSPLASGLVFSVLAAGFFATSMAAPKLARRFGRAPIAEGAALLAAAHLLQCLNLVAGREAGALFGLALLAVQGAGVGAVMAPLSAAVLAPVPAQHVGVASGLFATVQQIGNALGVALIGLLFFGLPQHGIEAASLYLAGSAALVAVLSWRSRAKPVRG